ncbi:MAG: metallopeptidase family protein [Phycisphaerales bacterium]
MKNHSMSPEDRQQFDDLLDEIVAELPPRLMQLLDEKPVVVDDQPSPEMLVALGLPSESSDEICGLHSGPMMTERTVEPGEVDLPMIHLFREGIVACAGGWTPWRAAAPDGEDLEGGGVDLIREEIRITLLHELGHHFGLDEDDLDQLGYA